MSSDSGLSSNAMTEDRVVSEHKFKSASRIQGSLLASLERRALNWLVVRLPGWVTSDQLTALGFGSMIAGAALYVWSREWASALLLVNICLALNWFGDSLDGTLARVRGKERPRYGYYVDHVIDALGILALVCGMALGGMISWVIGLAVLVTYYLLSIDVYLATHALGVFRMSFFKLGPTELRVLLAIANVRAFVKPTVWVFGQRHLFFDVAAVIAISVLVVVIAASISRNTRLLYQSERLNP